MELSCRVMKASVTHSRTTLTRATKSAPRAASMWMEKWWSICGVASPIPQPAERGKRTLRRCCSHQQKASRPSACIGSYNEAHSISMRRLRSTGPNLPPRGKLRYRYDGRYLIAQVFPAVDRPFTLEDVLSWHAAVAAVAAQKPEWEPGSIHGYHARTFGWIAGEIVRRITGHSLGRFFADEVAGPLGADCWIGLPEEFESRLAVVVPPPPISDPQIQAMMDQFMGPNTLLGRVMNKPDNLFAYDQRWNTRPYHAAELPSTNGIGSARALSRIYAACIGEVDGIRLLDATTVEEARTEQSVGTDAVLGVPTRFGSGFSLTWTLSPRAPEGSFGFAGAGGSLGFADPTNKIAFGYAMNRMLLTDFSRSTALVNAVYESL